MRCGGLFSGIGGFELAAKWVGMQNAWSNEIDSYCCKVLRKNFNYEIIEEDIRDCGKGRKRELRAVDVIFGGFPCQPFSTAGKRAGTGDNRYLWPEMLRVISEVRPDWVIGENVAGILSMGEQLCKPKVESRTVTRTEELDYYEAVLSLEERMLLANIIEDLEKIGYQVQPFVIPACSVWAPHRRDRVWIVANSVGVIRQQESKYGNARLEREVFHDKGREKSPIGPQAHYREFAPTPNNAQQPNGRHNSKQQHWYEVATQLCGMDARFSTELDQLKNSDRTNRLKALGNAIVPQVAFEILNAIRIIQEQYVPNTDSHSGA